MRYEVLAIIVRGIHLKNNICEINIYQIQEVKIAKL